MPSRSGANPNDAFVWIWLPEETEPVVAGRLVVEHDGRLSFGYGQSYLHRPNAISIYQPELPLRRGLQQPEGTLVKPSAFAMPRPMPGNAASSSTGPCARRGSPQKVPNSMSSHS